MIKIMSGKKFKEREDYISTLEIKIINLNKAYDMVKKEKEELEKKYKKVKMELYLKTGEE